MKPRSKRGRYINANDLTPRTADKDDRLYRFGYMSFAEIGDVLGITRQQVEQIYKQAIRKMNYYITVERRKRRDFCTIIDEERVWEKSYL